MPRRSRHATTLWQQKKKLRPPLAAGTVSEMIGDFFTPAERACVLSPNARERCKLRCWACAFTQNVYICKKRDQQRNQRFGERVERRSESKSEKEKGNCRCKR